MIASASASVWRGSPGIQPCRCCAVVVPEASISNAGIERVVIGDAVAHRDAGRKPQLERCVGYAKLDRRQADMMMGVDETRQQHLLRRRPRPARRDWPRRISAKAPIADDRAILLKHRAVIDLLPAMAVERARDDMLPANDRGGNGAALFNIHQLATDRASCSAKARSTSSCNSAVSWTRSAKAVGDVRSRGLCASIGTIALMRPGRAVNTTTRSASAIASSIWWVTNRHRGLADFPDVEQKALHLDARLDVERGEGLVHQQDLRLHRERARDGDALAHAARELVGALLERFGKADPRQNLTRRLLALLGRHAAHGKAEADVLPNVQPGKERGLLEDQAALGRRSDDSLAMRVNCPRGWLLETRDEIKQSAFAAAGRPQKNDELAWLDLEVDAGQRLVRPRAPWIPDLADANAADRGAALRSIADGHPLPSPPWPLGSQNKTRCCSSRRAKSNVKPSRPMMTMVK